MGRGHFPLRRLRPTDARQGSRRGILQGAGCRHGRKGVGQLKCQETFKKKQKNTQLLQLNYARSDV